MFTHVPIITFVYLQTLINQFIRLQYTLGLALLRLHPRDLPASSNGIFQTSSLASSSFSCSPCFFFSCSLPCASYSHPYFWAPHLLGIKSLILSPSNPIMQRVLSTRASALSTAAKRAPLPKTTGFNLQQQRFAHKVSSSSVSSI